MTHEITGGAMSAELTQEQKAIVFNNQLRTRADSPSRRAVRRFFRHKLAMAGVIMIGIMALMAIAAPLISPYSFSAMDVLNSAKPPSAAHWLGTDAFGRDQVSRLIFGGRVSLSVGLVAVGIYEAIAIVLGSLAGYYSGKTDMIIMRIVDIFMTFPWLIIVIYMVSILGPSVFNCMLAIGILGWTGPTRLVRAQILSLREMDYVTAARAVGVQTDKLILRHILPGVVAPLVVHATFGVASAILTEASLSFLGLGVQPPIASWGNMMSEALQLTILEQMPWLWIPPGIAIMLAVLSINFVGDGLRDALDPKGMVESH